MKYNIVLSENFSILMANVCNIENVLLRHISLKPILKYTTGQNNRKLAKTSQNNPQGDLN